MGTSQKGKQQSGLFLAGDKARGPEARTTARTLESMVRFEQTTFRLPAQRRGCHLVTNYVTKEINGLMSDMDVGMCQIFLQHTSASLSINENCDPDVRHDMETFLSQVVPEGYGPKVPWTHTAEGTDDMPAHVKSSMFGASLSIPITKGRLNLGTWQGIWLCEHRDHASSRTLVCTIMGS